MNKVQLLAENHMVSKKLGSEGSYFKSLINIGAGGSCICLVLVLKVSVKHCQANTKQNLHCLGKNTNVAGFTRSMSDALYCFLNLISL